MCSNIKNKRLAIRQARTSQIGIPHNVTTILIEVWAVCLIFLSCKCALIPPGLDMVAPK